MHVGRRLDGFISHAALPLAGPAALCILRHSFAHIASVVLVQKKWLVENKIADCTSNAQALERHNSARIIGNQIQHIFRSGSQQSTLMAPQPPPAQIVRSAPRNDMNHCGMVGRHKTSSSPPARAARPRCAARNARSPAPSPGCSGWSRGAMCSTWSPCAVSAAKAQAKPAGSAPAWKGRRGWE